MKHLFIASALALNLSLSDDASALLIDSFVDGAFSFSHNQSASRSEQQFGTMLGGDRIVSLSTNRRSTIVSASVVDGSDALDFDTGSGPVGPTSRQGSIILAYGGDIGNFPPTPLNLDFSVYDYLELDILSVMGMGEVSVSINGCCFGTSSIRLPLESSGLFRYPMTDANGVDFSETESIYIAMFGVTTDFVVRLGNVRAVPEPTFAAMFVALLIISTRFIQAASSCNAR